MSGMLGGFIQEPLLGPCIATVIPLLFVVFMIRDEKSKSVLLFFCWGSIAGLIAYGGNAFFSAMPNQSARVSIAIAPVIEEICKGLPVIFLFLRKKTANTGVFAVYCAMASGIGFSIQESIYYFSLTSGSDALISLIIRTITTALMHGVTTALLAVGMMLTIKQRYIFVPMIFGLLSLSASIHALFNMLLPTRLAFIAFITPASLYTAFLFLLEREIDN